MIKRRKKCQSGNAIIAETLWILQLPLKPAPHAKRNVNSSMSPAIFPNAEDLKPERSIPMYFSPAIKGTNSPFLLE
jgi:hypothetical protein